MAYLVDANGEQIDVGSPASLDNISPITVYAWMNVTTDGTGRRILEKYYQDTTTTEVGWQLMHQEVATDDSLIWWRSFATSKGAWSVGSLPQNQWVHVAVAYDDSSVNNDPLMYYNGVSQGAPTEADTPVGALDDDSSARLTIGNINHSTVDGERPLNGGICCVGIHEALLTIGEIQTAMRRGYTHRGLVGFWPLFNSGVDLSGNVNNGTVTNATVADHAPVAPIFSFAGNTPIAVAAAAAGQKAVGITDITITFST